MSRECEICGKGPQRGNQVTTRGKAKYLGGVGTKITGCTRREFRPNLQSVRVTTAAGTNRRMKVCAQCLRSGAVTKLIRSAPFKLPKIEGDKAVAKSSGGKASGGKGAGGKSSSGAKSSAKAPAKADAAKKAPAK